MPTRTHAALLLLLCALTACLGCEDDATPPPGWVSGGRPSTLEKLDAPPTTTHHHWRYYVPIYSEVYQDNAQRAQYLAATVSIRNVDASQRLIIDSVRYYDNDGALLDTIIDAPHALGPMGSANIFVGEKDKRGGHGANFIVEVSVEQPTSPP